MTYRLNIAFGTRMGGGPTLDDQTPFSADILCQQCVAVLKKHLIYRQNGDKGTLRIDPRQLAGCRLCTVLCSRFLTSDSQLRLEVEHVTSPRYGYFLEALNILFYLAGTSLYQNPNTLSLSLQLTKLEKDDRGHPPMVTFTRDISSSTNSQQSKEQLAKWFRWCSETHQDCNLAFPKTSFVPSRLIQISGSDDNSLRVRLEERKDLPKHVRYATLSHCWGSTVPFMLKLALLDSCLISISLDGLSKVFRDAIQVAWRLGIQYLWIDSLCIIQDSVEDWIAESSQMGSVYHNSILNIAATGFPNGENGLFVQRDPELIKPIAVSLDAGLWHWGSRPREERPGQRGFYIVDTDTWKQGVDESPLCKRGWVTQERALSVRTVHFGKTQLFWECMSENASEVYPEGLVSGTEIHNPKIFLYPGMRARKMRTEKLQSIREEMVKMVEIQKRDERYQKWMGKNMKEVKKRFGLSSANSSEDDDSESNFQWEPSRFSLEDFNLVEKDFEGCDLSIFDGLDIQGWPKMKEKLERRGYVTQSYRLASLPVRGMPLELSQWITVVQNFTRCSLTFSKDKLVAISGMAQSLSQDMNCDYLAGLWRRHLEHQLLWKVSQPVPAPHHDGTRGPSWSWASVDGAIQIADWRGHFNSGTPGDVTWFAKVDEASVQITDTGNFGQARSGSLTLTGRLGVIRLNQDNSDRPSRGNGTFAPTKCWIQAHWDTQEIEASFGKSGNGTYLWRYSIYGADKGPKTSLDPLDVFYLPVRLMEADVEGFDYEEPMLTGLLLLPTGKQKGEYRRVGQFELSQRWLQQDEVKIEPLTEPTRISDNKFFVSKHEHGQYTICVV